MRDNPRFTIVGLGELLWDHYADGRYLGGAPANVAVHAANLGERAAVVSLVGDDPEGEDAVAALAQRGIDTGLVQRAPGRGTGQVRVDIGPDAVPRFTCVSEIAYDAFRRDKRWPAYARHVGAVVFGTREQRSPAGRTAIRWFVNAAPGALKVYDANLRGWRPEMVSMVREALGLTDVGKFNEREFCEIRRALDAGARPRAFGRRLVEERGLRLLAVSLGPWGCWLCSPERDLYAPGYAIDPVDTTGAGDAFVAALTIGLLRNQPLPQVGKYANAVGAVTALHHSATPAFGPRDISHFLERHRASRAHADWESLIDAG